METIVCAEPFEIQREKLVRCTEIGLLLMGLLCFGVGLIVVWILLRLGGRKAIRKWADSLSYSTQNDTILIRQHFEMWGIRLWESERTIPLVKITDLQLVRGPIEIRYDLWCLKVQTAGQGNIRAEARLVALKSPEQIRELLLNNIRKLQSQ